MASKPKHNEPFGMEKYDLQVGTDLGALSNDQQEKLNQFKVNTLWNGVLIRLNAIMNWNYTNLPKNGLFCC